MRVLHYFFDMRPEVREIVEFSACLMNKDKIINICMSLAHLDDKKRQTLYQCNLKVSDLNTEDKISWRIDPKLSSAEAVKNKVKYAKFLIMSWNAMLLRGYIDLTHEIDTYFVKGWKFVD